VAAGETIRRKATAKTKRGFRWQVETTNIDEIVGFAKDLRYFSYAVQHEVVSRKHAPILISIGP
jgi:hypothetical protein